MTACWPRPNFLATRRGPPALAWLWAATGVAVLALTLVEVVGERQHAETQAARLALATQRIARNASVSAASVTPVDAKVNAAAIGAARRVSERLAHPWGRILANVESETPTGLQWLMFDHDSGSADLRFEGLAPDVATALQLADLLSARIGWSDVVLGRLQIDDARGGASGSTPWRFEIRAVIDAHRMAAVNDGAH